MAYLPDPRYTTTYGEDFKGKRFHHCDKFLMPASAYEKICYPGYQPVRPDKGYQLQVNDYPFDPIHYSGVQWSKYTYVYPPVRPYDD
jgi:hypothetical protein